MSDFIIDGKQGNKSLRMASIKKRGKSEKKSDILRKPSEVFQLEDMLDIVTLVNIGLKGEKLPKVNNARVLSCAERIIHLSSRPETRDRAELMIRNLNHKIVTENRRVCNRREGKRLYDDLMQS